VSQRHARWLGRFGGLFCVLILVSVGAASASTSQSLVLAPSSPSVGDVVTGDACGLTPSHWFEMDTYGPNTTVDGPLDTTHVGRISADGCTGTLALLNPAQIAGAYSVYIYDCGGKGTGIGCAYGSHKRVLVDLDFTVAS